MKTAHLALGLAAFGLIARAEAAAPAYDQPGPLAVKTLDFPDLVDPARRGRSVPLKVHFPAQRAAYPLVVMSHGGGCDRDSYLYQVQHLASHGYVVVCTEHVLSNTKRVKRYMSPAGGGMTLLQALHRITIDPQAVLGRPRDVSFAIDKAIGWNRGLPALAGKIDASKIAIMGHSFGAYTTLVVCGARPILDYLRPPVAPGKGLAGDLSDSRVTFGLAMSPQSPGTTFFDKTSYKTIDRPLMCLSGSRDVEKGSDGRLMLPLARWSVWWLLPPGEKYFLWLTNADHLSFIDGPNAYRLPSKARPDAQRISKAMMVVSCDHFLKHKPQAAAHLTSAYVNTLCGEVVTRVGWKEK